MRRSRIDHRCDRCWVHERICLCPILPSLEARTRVILLLHFREQNQTSNTGHLLHLALPNSEMRVYADFENPMRDDDLDDPAFQTYALFPGEGATELSRAEVEADERPVRLAIPDGTWRQAAKMMLRCPTLHRLPRRLLPPGPPSRYQLRRAEDPARISTFEAGARALGLLEGPEVQRRLEEEVFRVMVERSLWARNRLPAEAVTGGLSEEALRYGHHDTPR
jgi:DTW domain-containing protein YfiP